MEVIYTRVLHPTLDLLTPVGVLAGALGAAILHHQLWLNMCSVFPSCISTRNPLVASQRRHDVVSGCVPAPASGRCGATSMVAAAVLPACNTS